jgi:hypothetical protein
MVRLVTGINISPSQLVGITPAPPGTNRTNLVSRSNLPGSVSGGGVSGGASGGSGVSIGGSIGGGGGGGGGVSVTPLQVVQTAALTGKPIVIPKFANTPKGIIQRSNFVQEVAKISLKAAEPTGSLNVQSKYVSQKIEAANKVATETKAVVEKYNAEGKSLEQEARTLSAQAAKINPYNTSEAQDFNARVNAFNAKVQDYSGRQAEINKQVFKTQQAVESANLSAEKIGRIIKFQTVETPSIIPITRKVGVSLPSDTRAPYYPSVKEPEPKPVLDVKFLGAASPADIKYGERYEEAKDVLLKEYSERNKPFIEKGMIVGESVPSVIDIESRAVGILPAFYKLQKGAEESATQAKQIEQTGGPLGKVAAFSVGAAYGAGMTGLSLAEDISPISVGPKGLVGKTPLAKTGSGLIYTVTNPSAVAASLAAGAAESPAFFLGEQAGQIIAFSKAGSLLESTTGAGSKVVALVKKAPGVKTVSAKLGALKEPIIKFEKYSPINETRIRAGELTVASGKGKILATQTNKIRQFLKRAPKEIEMPVEYKFDLKKVYDAAGKVPTRFPKGAPDTLIGILPEEKLLQLFKGQKELTTSLGGRVGFTGEGIIKFEGPTGIKDVKIIGEKFDSYAKNVRVRTSPSELVKNEFFVKSSPETQASFKLKLATVGDESLVGGKVSGVKLSDDLAVYSQRLRSKGGPKLDVKVFEATGTAPSAFEFGKVKAVSLKKPSVSLSETAVRAGNLKLAQVVKVEKLSPKVSTAPLIIKAAEKVIRAEVKPKVTVSTKQLAFAVAINKGFDDGEFEFENVSSGFRVGEIPKVSTRTTSVSFGQQQRVSVGAMQVTKPSVRVSELSKVREAVSVRSAQAASTRQSVSEKIAQLVSPASLTRQAQALSVKQAQALSVKQAQALSVKQAQITIQRVRPITKTVTRTRTITPAPPIPPIITITRIPPMRFGAVMFAKGKKRLLNAFDVEIREKGKFRKIGKGLPKGKALLLGSRTADIETSRTFRLTPTGFTTAKDIKAPNLEKFREPFGKSKLKAPLTFVEKSKYAISSRQEKFGIPGRAAQLKRLKRVSIFA